jgi:phosphate transport system substrate-binding protein
MKHRRLAAAISLLAAGATVLSGCEVSHTSMAYASVVVNCGGKSAISASGSTAQANAMKRFVSAYSKSAPDTA